MAIINCKLNLCRITVASKLFSQSKFYPLLKIKTPGDVAKEMCTAGGGLFKPRNHYMPVLLKSNQNNYYNKRNTNHNHEGSNNKPRPKCKPHRRLHGFRYVTVRLEQNRHGKLLTLLDSRPKARLRGHYVYRVDERDTCLVLDAQLEEAARVGEIADLTIADHADKTILRLKTGDKLTAEAIDYEINNNEVKLYEGRAQTNKDFEKRYHHYGRATMNIARIFEDKEREAAIRELERLRHEAVRRRRIEEDWKDGMSQLIANLKPSKKETATVSIEPLATGLVVENITKTLNVCEKLTVADQLLKLPPVKQVDKIVKHHLANGVYTEVADTTGILLTIDDRQCFIVGQNIHTNTGETLFVPGQTFSNGSEVEYRPGITVNIGGTPAFVAGAIFPDTNGTPVFLPGHVVIDSNGSMTLPQSSDTPSDMVSLMMSDEEQRYRVNKCKIERKRLKKRKAIMVAVSEAVALETASISEEKSVTDKTETEILEDQENFDALEDNSQLEDNLRLSEKMFTKENLVVTNGFHNDYRQADETLLEKVINGQTETIKYTERSECNHLGQLSPEELLKYKLTNGEVKLLNKGILENGINPSEILQGVNRYESGHSETSLQKEISSSKIEPQNGKRHLVNDIYANGALEQDFEQKVDQVGYTKHMALEISVAKEIKSLQNVEQNGTQSLTNGVHQNGIAEKDDDQEIGQLGITKPMTPETSSKKQIKSFQKEEQNGNLSCINGVKQNGIIEGGSHGVSRTGIAKLTALETSTETDLSQNAELRETRSLVNGVHQNGTLDHNHEVAQLDTLQTLSVGSVSKQDVPYENGLPMKENPILEVAQQNENLKQGSDLDILQELGIPLMKNYSLLDVNKCLENGMYLPRTDELVSGITKYQKIIPQEVGSDSEISQTQNTGTVINEQLLGNSTQCNGISDNGKASHINGHPSQQNQILQKSPGSSPQELLISQKQPITNKCSSKDGINSSYIQLGSQNESQIRLVFSNGLISSKQKPGVTQNENLVSDVPETLKQTTDVGYQRQLSHGEVSFILQSGGLITNGEDLHCNGMDNHKSEVPQSGVVPINGEISSSQGHNYADIKRLGQTEHFNLTENSQQCDSTNIPQPSSELLKTVINSNKMKDEVRSQNNGDINGFSFHPEEENKDQSTMLRSEKLRRYEDQIAKGIFFAETTTYMDEEFDPLDYDPDMIKARGIKDKLEVEHLKNLQTAAEMNNAIDALEEKKIRIQEKLRDIQKESAKIPERQVTYIYPAKANALAIELGFDGKPARDAAKLLLGVARWASGYTARFHVHGENVIGKPEVEEENEPEAFQEFSLLGEKLSGDHKEALRAAMAGAVHVLRHRPRDLEACMRAAGKEFARTIAHCRDPNHVINEMSAAVQHRTNAERNVILSDTLRDLTKKVDINKVDTLHSIMRETFDTEKIIHKLALVLEDEGDILVKGFQNLTAGNPSLVEEIYVGVVSGAATLENEEEASKLAHKAVVDNVRSFYDGQMKYLLREGDSHDIGHLLLEARSLAQVTGMNNEARTISRIINEGGDCMGTQTLAADHVTLEVIRRTLVARRLAENSPRLAAGLQTLRRSGGEGRCRLSPQDTAARELVRESGALVSYACPILNSHDIPSFLMEMGGDSLAMEDFLATRLKRSGALLISRGGVQAVVPKEASRLVLAGLVDYTLIDDRGVSHFRPMHVFSAWKMDKKREQRYHEYSCLGAFDKSAYDPIPVPEKPVRSETCFNFGVGDKWKEHVENPLDDLPDLEMSESGGVEGRRRSSATATATYRTNTRAQRV